MYPPPPPPPPLPASQFQGFPWRGGGCCGWLAAAFGVKHTTLADVVSIEGLMPWIFDCWLWKASNRDMEPLASLPPQNCDRIFVINCSAWPRC